MSIVKKQQQQKKQLSRNARENIELYLILCPVIVLILIFPMRPCSVLSLRFRTISPASLFSAAG